MIIFSVVFAALFRGSPPSTEIIILNCLQREYKNPCFLLFCCFVLIYRIVSFFLLCCSVYQTVLFSTIISFSKSVRLTWTICNNVSIVVFSSRTVACHRMSMQLFLFTTTLLYLLYQKNRTETTIPSCFFVILCIFIRKAAMTVNTAAAYARDRIRNRGIVPLWNGIPACRYTSK